MHIYYTDEDGGVPTITYPYMKSAVEGTMVAFDDTVHKIMEKDFRHCTNVPKICDSEVEIVCEGGKLIVRAFYLMN